MSDAVAEKAARRLRGMGRIFQRSGSPYWWVAYFHRGKEIRESSKSTDERQAEKLLKQRIKRIHADQLGAQRFVGPVQERVTVDDLLDALEADFRLRNKLSRQTLAHLRPIRQAFGDRRAVDVTPEMVDRYIQDRTAFRSEADRVIPGKASATANRECQLLGQAYRFAIKRGHLTHMPAIRRLDTTGNVRRGFFEAEEFEKVVAHLSADLRDLVRFGYLTGWRKSEITSLRWSEVDGQVIRLRPEAAKNREGRQVPLEGEIRAIIERCWAGRQYQNGDGITGLSEYVFHRGDGQRVGDFRRVWATACKAAGVSGRLFHDLRRTAVRNMVRAGVSQHVAMDISGHKTESMFRRYNITSERDLREAMRRTQEHLASTRPTVVILPLAVSDVTRGRNR